MSSIVLSAAVRQNLLALQDTAAQLATTQNDLSTGKKVNSALDNPTNFFTASGLDNRASDISNLLDGISNGVQVLQAANTGLTSIESLVSQAQSIANQALQTSIGYSTKATVSSGAINGATAQNLLGTATYTSGAATTGSTVTGLTASTTLASLTTVANGDTLAVNGKTFTFSSSSATSISASGGTISTTGTVQDVLDAINAVTGGSGSSATAVASNAVTLQSGTLASASLSGTSSEVLSALGLSAAGAQTATGTQNNTGSTLAQGSTLIIPAVGTGGASQTITFGSGNGQVSTLDQLNAALADNNLQATVDGTTGALTITTTNDSASSSIGTISGTATGNGTVFSSGLTPAAPVADATSQATRATLVSQYNAILTQIDNTASDSSYNGVNLLNGDQLQLTFDETGKSKLSITGVQDSAAGLGLANLSSTAFADNNDTNGVLSTLNTVSTSLRSQASAFGSNLSVVQTRQDFNTNLINVLQTGSANLTQADINLEAANSQALSTRQSLSVSALSLANQSQQSVLQLLR